MSDYTDYKLIYPIRQYHAFRMGISIRLLLIPSLTRRLRANKILTKCYMPSNKLIRNTWKLFLMYHQLPPLGESGISGIYLLIIVIEEGYKLTKDRVVWVFEALVEPQPYGNYDHK